MLTFPSTFLYIHKFDININDESTFSYHLKKSTNYQRNITSANIVLIKESVYNLFKKG